MHDQQIKEFEDYDEYMAEWEATEDKCQTEGCEGYMMRAHVSDGPDDYKSIWYCRECEAVESE